MGFAMIWDMSAAWLGFGLFFMFFLIFMYSIIRYYEDPITRHPLPNAVILISMTFSIISVLLVPVDVYVLSYAPEEVSIVRDCYYAFFAGMVVLCFVVIPFAYFFAEDLVFNEDDDEMTCCARATSALKYTSLSIIFILLILLAGVYLEPGSSAQDGIKNEHDLVQWVDTLMDLHKGAPGARALLMATAVLACFGAANFIIYTGYGMAALPVVLIRGNPEDTHERLQVDFDTMRLRQRKMEIQRKYNEYERLPRKDLKELAKINRQEKLLAQRNALLQSDDSNWTVCCMKALAPFRVTLGLVFLGLSLLLVGSLVLTSLDKAFNSLCGVRCGFVLSKSHFFNPVDKALVALSSFFPLDYVALAAIALYSFVASLFAMFRIGIRIAGIQVYKIEKGHTWPQALLCCALFLMLVILGLTVELLTLAPQYATFGAQTFTGSDGLPTPCAVASSQAVAEVCKMSQISTIIAQITITMPFFSLAYFVGNWLFIAFFGLTLMRLFCRGAEPLDKSYDGDIDDFELVRLLRR